MSEYEERLRMKRDEAIAAYKEAWGYLETIDAHPNSSDYKSAQQQTLLAGGRIWGLSEALSLTGADYEEFDPRPENW